MENQVVGAVDAKVNACGIVDDPDYVAQRSCDIIIYVKPIGVVNGGGGALF